MSRWWSVVAIFIAAALGLSCLVGAFAVNSPAGGGAHSANADDAALVAQGKSVYMGHCASCHGRNLQGQPLWQLRDEFAARRAPAHDETGHTWQHSDEEIFHMIKYGRFASVSAEIVSFMPALDKALDDREILAVMAFIKARWPIGLRVLQATLNPGRAGMPRNAAAEDWRLPPTCGVLRQRIATPAAASSGGTVKAATVRE
jgi:S-disulfanyl-L-cysteine oxidoreductase SoxD